MKLTGMSLDVWFRIPMYTVPFPCVILMNYEYCRFPMFCEYHCYIFSINLGKLSFYINLQESKITNTIQYFVGVKCIHVYTCIIFAGQVSHLLTQANRANCTLGYWLVTMIFIVR